MLAAATVHAQRSPARRLLAFADEAPLSLAADIELSGEEFEALSDLPDR